MRGLKKQRDLADLKKEIANLRKEVDLANSRASVALNAAERLNIKVDRLKEKIND